MVSSKEEIIYNILEKNLNEYEPITDERIKNFIIENKRLNPFLKEVYPIIKKVKKWKNLFGLIFIK